MPIKNNMTNGNSPTPENPCWRTFAHHPHLALRIELCSRRVWLLPYAQWLHADLEELERGELLTIHFGSHEVCVEGNHLSEVLLEFQACNVELLREVPQHFRTPGRSPVIRTIRVSEAMDAPTKEISRESSVERNQTADALN